MAGSYDETELLRGFASGATDYITTPVRVGELLARLRAHLRGFVSSDDVALTIGPYTFRPSVKLLHDPARKRLIVLSSKEADLLRVLRRAGGKVVSRRSLLDVVWGYNAAVTTHTLETHIYRLRQKIEPDPGNPHLLGTVSGGYYLEVTSPCSAGDAGAVTAELGRSEASASRDRSAVDATQAGKAADNQRHSGAGGPDRGELARLTEFEEENARLRRAIAELALGMQSLDKAVERGHQDTDSGGSRPAPPRDSTSRPSQLGKR